MNLARLHRASTGLIKSSPSDEEKSIFNQNTRQAVEDLSRRHDMWSRIQGLQVV